uniref:Uncharacterized protein n=1 Tax=Ascaris lumbricoides TaxID=6252 RepID=A0A0M3HF74_ASCLU
MSNDEWVAQNLQKQRRILEEKQRQKRLLTGGIRLNDPPKENLNRTIISRSGNSNREFYAYDGPLSFGPDDPDRISPSIAGPTIITVRGVTPPTVQRFEFFQFIMRKNFFTKDDYLPLHYSRASINKSDDVILYCDVFSLHT